MKKTATIAIIVVIFILAGLFIFLQRGEKDLVFTMDNSEAIAREWIIESSPTFVFDGFDLELRNKKEITEGESYEFIFNFKTRSGGFGDRSAQIVPQVITPRTMTIVVENGEVVKAITNDAFSETENRVIWREEFQQDFEIRIMPVYFGKMNGNEELFPISRTIPSGDESLEILLKELIKGPTRAEIDQGFYSSINTNTEIQSIRIDNGVAFIDFSSELEKGIAGSATVTFIRNQIEKTLLQFQEINELIISINGRTEDILQP